MSSKQLLTYDEIESIFDEIKTKKKYIKYGEHIIFFQYPSKSDFEECRKIEKTLELKFEYIPSSVEDIPNIDIKFIEAEKIKLEKILKSESITSNKESLVFYSKKLEDINKQILEYNTAKNRSKSYDYFLLDKKIKYLSYLFLFSRSTFRLKNNKPTYLVTNQKSLFFWYRTLNEEFIKFYCGPEDLIIRQIARNSKISTLWKISCSTGSPLFDGSISEYTPVQIKLCFWLGFYSDVFKNLGSPDSENIINDDALFDKWVQDKIKELKSSKTDSPSQSKGAGSGHTRQHKIIFKNPTHASNKRLSKKEK